VPFFRISIDLSLLAEAPTALMYGRSTAAPHVRTFSAVAPVLRAFLPLLQLDTPQLAE